MLIFFGPSDQSKDTVVNEPVEGRLDPSNVLPTWSVMFEGGVNDVILYVVPDLR